jgi:hypothetical protein
MGRYTACVIALSERVMCEADCARPARHRGAVTRSPLCSAQQNSISVGIVTM